MYVFRYPETCGMRKCEMTKEKAGGKGVAAKFTLLF